MNTSTPLTNTERLQAASRLLWDAVEHWDDDALVHYPQSLPCLEEVAASLDAIELNESKVSPPSEHDR